MNCLKHLCMGLLLCLCLSGCAKGAPDAPNASAAAPAAGEDATSKPPAPAADDTASKTPQAEPETVAYESVERMHYPDGNAPYFHDVYTNGTSKTILRTERAMLAYDEEGQPLKLKWHPMDSSDTPAYLCVYTAETRLLPGETEDVPGGWSLDDDAAAYALYCDISITFADGTVWENPDYAAWLDTYLETAVDPSALKAYYPFVQTVETAP